MDDSLGAGYKKSKSLSLDLNPDLDRGGCSVYVQDTTNQPNIHRIKQPKTYYERYLDNNEETLVANFDHKDFVWWSECLTDDLPELYREVLERLRVLKGYYAFELRGFVCFRHKEDNRRRCDINYIYLPHIYCGKYHPYASVKHKRRACMRTLERLENLEKKTKNQKKRYVKGKKGKKGWYVKDRFDYLVKVDLTLPKCISFEWCDKEAQIRIRKALQRFLELLHDALFPKKEGSEGRVSEKHESQFGVICNHHFWATRHPLDPHRHLHLTIPNVCYNKSKNRFYRFKPYFDDDEVVKECWTDALGEFGLWVERKNEEGKRVLADCRLGYVKFSERNKVINRLSYVCRKPTEDMVKYLRAEDLEFFEDGKEFANFLINYTPRVVNLGFLTNLKRFGFYSNTSKTMICPICGGEMVALVGEKGLIVSLDRPPPHTAKLLRDRTGVWYVLS